MEPERAVALFQQAVQLVPVSSLLSAAIVGKAITTSVTVQSCAELWEAWFQFCVASSLPVKQVVEVSVCVTGVPGLGHHSSTPWPACQAMWSSTSACPGECDVPRVVPSLKGTCSHQEDVPEVSEPSRLALGSGLERSWYNMPSFCCVRWLAGPHVDLAVILCCTRMEQGEDPPDAKQIRHLYEVAVREHGRSNPGVPPWNATIDECTLQH